MIEPVAYLVSQEPLSSVRWLSDVKPIGVDNKQITPLYTADQLQPTIEMTEMQMKQMMSFKEVNAGFSTFMYKQGLGQLSAFSDFITTQRENELMQAWLHPEIIKVVDE